LNYIYFEKRRPGSTEQDPQMKDALSSQSVGSSPHSPYFVARTTTRTTIIIIIIIIIKRLIKPFTLT